MGDGALGCEDATGACETADCIAATALAVTLSFVALVTSDCGAGVCEAVGARVCEAGGVGVPADDAAIGVCEVAACIAAIAIVVTLSFTVLATLDCGAGAREAVGFGALATGVRETVEVDVCEDVCGFALLGVLPRV